jgi:hypothetical protein
MVVIDMWWRSSVGMKDEVVSKSRSEALRVCAHLQSSLPESSLAEMKAGESRHAGRHLHDS